MSKVNHTQGLWEIQPGTLEIKTSASDKVIANVTRPEDAALIVCASAMFTALCFAAEGLQDPDAQKRANLAQVLRKLIRQANGTGDTIRYGAINSEMGH